MSIYLRCLLFIFLYLLAFEILNWAIVSSFLSSYLAERNSSLSSHSGVLGLLLSQAVIAYFFCFVMARSDSTSKVQYVIKGAGIGILLFVYKAGCMLVSQNLNPEFLWITPLVILQFGGAAYIFAKHQI